MSAHTQGPWKIDADHASNGEINGSDNITVARVHPRSYSREGIANARLIASAPELLEALIKLTNEAQGLLDVIGSEIQQAAGNTNHQVFAGRVRESRAAIAKAEGRG